MNVTRLQGGITYDDIPKPTEGEMQREYGFILAENLTRKLLEKGLISKDEYGQIMDKNRQTFSPFLSQI